MLMIITDKPFRQAAASVLLPLILVIIIFKCGLSTGAPADMRAQQLNSRFAQRHRKQSPLSNQRSVVGPMSPSPQQPQAPLRQEYQQRSSYSPQVQAAPQGAPRWFKPLQHNHQQSEMAFGMRPPSEHGSVEGDYKFENYQGDESASQIHDPGHDEHEYNQDLTKPFRKLNPLAIAKDIIIGKKSTKNSATLNDGLTFNNYQETFKIGNKKKVNMNSINNNFAPTISNRQMDKYEGTNGHPSLVAPAGSKNAEFNNGDSPGAEKDKKEATKEQKKLKKKLKKKLLELADKATSVPANTELLKLNRETNQLEPVAEDPQANEHKQKLKDALGTLLARKMSTERLKEALGIDDDDDDDQNEGETAHRGMSPVVRAMDGAPQGTEHNVLEDELNFVGEPPELYHEEEQPLSHYSGDGFEVGTGEPWDLHSESSHVSGHLGEHHQPEDFDENDSSSSYEPSLHPDGEMLHPDGSSFELDELQQDGAPPADQLDPDSIQQLRNILGDRLRRISDLLYFSPEFLNQLILLSDQNLTPIEAQFKRMVLCNSDEQFCNQDLSDAILNDDAQSAHDGLSQLEPEDESYSSNFERFAPQHFEDEGYSSDSSENSSEEEAHLHDQEHYPAGSFHDHSLPLPFVPPPQYPQAISLASVAPRRLSHSKSSTYYSYNHAREDTHFGEQTPQSDSFAQSSASVDDGSLNGASSINSHNQPSISPTNYAVAGVKPDHTMPISPTGPTQTNSIKVRQQSPSARPQTVRSTRPQQERAPPVPTVNTVHNVHQQPRPYQAASSPAGPQQPPRVAHRQPAPQHQPKPSRKQAQVVHPPTSVRAASPMSQQQQQQPQSRPVQQQQQQLQQANSPPRGSDSLQVQPKHPLAGQYQAQRQQQQTPMIGQTQQPRAYPGLRATAPLTQQSVPQQHLMAGYRGPPAGSASIK